MMLFLDHILRVFSLVKNKMHVMFKQQFNSLQRTAAVLI